jgi:adenylate kinase
MPNKALRNKLTLVVLGRSGSGKGTQAALIVGRLGGKKKVARIETGKFLREMIKNYRNPTIDFAEDLFRGGKLFPGWFPAFIWLKEMIEHGSASKHWVMDGAPRRVWEAELVDEVMREHGRPLSVCIYVDTSLTEAKKRLFLRGRSDDNAVAIRNRMNFFKKEVLKVIGYYKKSGRLIRVNGDLYPEGVWHEIDAALRKKLKKRWPSR